MGRAAPGCSQPNLTLSHQQQHQHGASRNGIRERKIHFNPLGPAAGLDPAGQWGSGGSVLPREVQLGRNPPGCCCPAPSGHTLQGKEVGFAEIMDEKGHTSPALLCWPLCLFPQFSQNLEFLLGLHATPALLPAVAWIQPACISQSPCFRYHLFLGCPTCSKDKEPRPFQRSQHEKQGFMKKTQNNKPKNQSKPLSFWEHHIHLSVPHRQTNTGIACPSSGGEQGTRASLSWDSP